MTQSEWPTFHEGQGQEDVKEAENGCFTVQQSQGQATNESAGGPKTNQTIDNCVESTISQSIVVKRKLSQSEVDRMKQDTEKSEMRTRSTSRSTRPRVFREMPHFCVEHTD